MAEIVRDVVARRCGPFQSATPSKRGKEGYHTWVGSDECSTKEARRSRCYEGTHRMQKQLDYSYVAKIMHNNLKELPKIMLLEGQKQSPCYYWASGWLGYYWGASAWVAQALFLTFPTYLLVSSPLLQLISISIIITASTAKHRSQQKSPLSSLSQPCTIINIPRNIPNIRHFSISSPFWVLPLKRRLSSLRSALILGSNCSSAFCNIRPWVSSACSASLNTCLALNSCVSTSFLIAVLATTTVTG